MHFHDPFLQGQTYADFLAHYATEPQKQRWQHVHAEVNLTSEQRDLLASFTRQMKVLCLAGAWCGDCINQCPIFAHFADTASVIELRFLDRDDHADVQEALRINAGQRVPVVVFLSEDEHEVARYGDRTLSTYRHLVQDLTGPACPTGIVAPAESLLARVTQDWLNEFERVQWLLRLSPRLRQRHGD